MRRPINVTHSIVLAAGVLSLVGWQAANTKAPIVFFRGNGKVTIKSNGKVRVVLNSAADLRKPQWVLSGDTFESTGTAYIIYESNGEWKRGPQVTSAGVGSRRLAGSLKGARSQSGSKSFEKVEFVAGEEGQNRLYIPEDTRLRIVWAHSGTEELTKLEVPEASFSDLKPKAKKLTESPLNSYESDKLATVLRGLRKDRDDVPVTFRLTFGGKTVERKFKLVSKGSSGSLNSAFNRWQESPEEAKDEVLNDYLLALEAAGCGATAADIAIAEWEKDKENWAAREWMAGLGARSKSHILEDFFVKLQK